MKKQSKYLPNGFKLVKNSDLAINDLGAVYNIKTKRTRKPKTVTTKYGRITTEKAVLWVFNNETPRNGHITHIDGQKSNKSLENIKYSTLELLTTPENFKTTEPLNKTNLRKAINCYFPIGDNARPNTNQQETKMFLNDIAAKREFHIKNENEPLYKVFSDWLTCKSINAVKAGKMNGITYRGALSVINLYVNRLTAEICNDLNNGLLNLQPFVHIQREKRKAETKALHKKGIKRTASFRIPKDIKAEFEKLGIEPPKASEINKLKNPSQRSNMFVWLNLALACLDNAPKETNRANLKARGKLYQMIERLIMETYDLKHKTTKQS